MCGIAGKLDFSGSVDPAPVARMCAAMEHRGPDSRGMWCGDNIVLGMQRLAIIDIEGGDQPIFNEDRSVAVIMNGEIYNFEELRDKLRRAGHRFATRSDTEVLVHLYEEYGENFVTRMRGMFAFAIWDRRRQRLLLGRDRVGKKPLYVMRRGSRVWFASELTALLQDSEVARTPEPRAIASYLALQYVPHPLSAFKGVEKLAPASTLSITARGSDLQRYWSLDYRPPAHPLPRQELEERLRELIWEATRIRLLSEVPLGALLSGGIDSSVVVAAMAAQSAGPVKTFSIGFPDEAFDELHYARLVADRFSTEHHEFIVEPDALDIGKTLARHYGEPFADPSAIPSFFLARMTSQHVTVALNGDGGDESFAGYGRYISRDPADHFDRVPLWLRREAPFFASALGHSASRDTLRSRIQRLAGRVAIDRRLRYAEAMSVFRSSMRTAMLQPEFLASTEAWHPEDLIDQLWEASTARSTVDHMLDVDVNTYLPGDLLAKMDIACMAYSVEGRSPLLDHQLMEFAAQLPANLKLNRQNGKDLLKSALRGILPDEVLDRPKMGFGVPLQRWFREELRHLPAEVLLSGDARVHTYVKPAAIASMIDEHQQHIADHSHRLWLLLQLELWHREVLEHRNLQNPAERELPT